MLVISHVTRGVDKEAKRQKMIYVNDQCDEKESQSVAYFYCLLVVGNLIIGIDKITRKCIYAIAVEGYSSMIKLKHLPSI